MKVLLPVILSLAFARITSAIVNGEAADSKGAWPWQGALYSYGRYSCGAVLVSENYALTAAYCLSGARAPEAYTLLFGADDRITRNEGQSEVYEVEEFKVHPDYMSARTRGFPNNLAGLKLARPANLNNPFIDIVKLAPRNSTDRVRVGCYITGWGAYCGGCRLANQLQQADIQVVSTSECNAKMADRIDAKITESQICAFDDDEQRGPCFGDEGGPLVCTTGENSDWKLEGIYSWGLRGCDTSAPSVYTRVNYYSDWLCEWTEGEVGCADKS